MAITWCLSLLQKGMSNVRKLNRRQKAMLKEIATRFSNSLYFEQVEALSKITNTNKRLSFDTVARFLYRLMRERIENSFAYATVKGITQSIQLANTVAESEKMLGDAIASHRQPIAIGKIIKGTESHKCYVCRKKIPPKEKCLQVLIVHPLHTTKLYSYYCSECYRIRRK